MPEQLLWVENVKAKDQHGGNSARQNQARIRSHVQSNRRHHGAHINRHSESVPRTKELWPSDSVKGLPTSSLRPSRSLGRLASRSAEGGPRRKRHKPKASSTEHSHSKDPNSSTGGAALTRSLPFLWHGLTSSERSSLTFFQLRTSQEWSGWEDSYFWNLLALQASQQSQAVARSLIAVSTLHERMGALDSVERTRLQTLSCEQSGKAMRALVRSELSYFEALVSCLVMICFHGLQHSQASFALLRSGLRMLAECNEPGRTSREEQRMLDLQIRPLFSRLLARPCIMGDMCKAFALSTEKHRAKVVAPPEEKPLVPLAFSTLSEARDCLKNILNWAHDSLPPRTSPRLSTKSLLDELRELKNAWQTSLAGSHFPKTSHAIKSRKLLKAASLIGMIIINTAYSVEESVFDEYQNDFEEILSLVEGAWSSGHSFGIDAGLFDITSFVGSKCRDPHIRRHALRLLKSGDDRLEGDRIAANPATILEALIALEERDVEVTRCHDVPEQNRRRLICGQQHIAQGRIDLFYESGDGSQKERCCVSLAGPNTKKASRKFDPQGNIPDAIFGTGYAAYLENRETMSYFRFEMDRFYFPIPKV